eukprot:202717-Hanusia_phi.AAC.1
MPMPGNDRMRFNQGIARNLLSLEETEALGKLSAPSVTRSQSHRLSGVTGHASPEERSAAFRVRGPAARHRPADP